MEKLKWKLCRRSNMQWNWLNCRHHFYLPFSLNSIIPFYINTISFWSQLRMSKHLFKDFRIIAVVNWRCAVCVHTFNECMQLLTHCLVLYFINRLNFIGSQIIVILIVKGLEIIHKPDLLDIIRNQRPPWKFIFC